MKLFKSIINAFNPPINRKKRAAIWILKTASKPKEGIEKYTVTAKVDADGSRREIDSIPTYDFYKFTELQPKSGFSKETFYYALRLLYLKEYINPRFGEDRDYNIIEFQCTKEGVIALHDMVYEKEIAEYNNDRFYLRGRWLLPLIAIGVAIISLYFSTCRKQPATILPLLRIDSIQVDTTYKGLKLPRTDSANPPKSKKDTCGKS
jgi:hypothetical protein